MVEQSSEKYISEFEPSTGNKIRTTYYNYDGPIRQN
ncbi:DUF2963 domain-containing protein [Candidatus Phytoplasma ziziphi]